MSAESSRDTHALHMMGTAEYEAKNYDSAEKLVRTAITEDPTIADFYVTLGMIWRDQGKANEALMSFQKAISIDPTHHRALVDLANLSKDLGAQTRNDNMMDAALNFYNRALAVRADEQIYLDMALVHHLGGHVHDAIETGKACLEHYPQSLKAMLYIAGSYDTLQEYEHALEYSQKALAIDPHNGNAYAIISSSLKNLGRLEESIEALNKALDVAAESDKPWIYSNMLLTMVYASSVSPEELAEASRAFGERFADPLRRNRPFQNNKNPHKKLRIGYVSPDFRGHAVVYFLAPVFYCNKEDFEIFAYSRTEKEDSITDFLKPLFDQWRDIKYLDDDKTADLIEKDKIDILIDLAGHTANNSLLAFARKPAPIQISWLGYPATIGMKAMDYRITDSYAEPLSMTEHLNVEELWRLPDIFCAYLPHPKSPAVIDHPPFEDNGYITFGCFNNFSKVTDDVLQVWAKIMEKVSNSRLLLEIFGINNEKIRAETLARLVKQGLPAERLVLEPRSTANQFVLYNKIDIALDPFPCNGGTTSFDALWMGVPFVTLAGRHFVSRMGVTVLTNAGLPELVAQTTDEYIKIASGLANDHDILKKTRGGLREKVAASPLMDQKKFARNMEAAYREMWKKWAA